MQFPFPDGTAQNKTVGLERAEEVKLKLKIKGRDLTLKLKKNTNVDSDIPVIVLENGKATRWEDPDNDVCGIMAILYNYHTRDPLKTATTTLLAVSITVNFTLKKKSLSNVLRVEVNFGYQLIFTVRA